METKQQFIVKVPGNEYDIDRVLQILLNHGLEIVSTETCGGGLMGGAILSYIVVNGEDPGIERQCENYVNPWEKEDVEKIEKECIEEINKLGANPDYFKARKIREDYEKKKDKFRDKIKGVEVLKAEK